MSFKAYVVLALVLASGASCYGSLSAPSSASASRQEIINTLNQRFRCQVASYSSGEQLTFGREIGPPSCPVSVDNYNEASALLISLANTLSPPDAVDFRNQAQQLSDIGPILKHLADLKQRLVTEGVVQGEGKAFRVLHIGHPFEQTNHDDELWAYATLAHELELRHLTCELPACDPVLLQVAKAVTERPELALNGNQIVAPNSYDLSAFSQRYAPDTVVRAALGLTVDWDWNPQNFSSHYRAETGELVFPQILPQGRAILTLAGWDQRTEYPDVLPLYYLIQEAEGVFRHLQALPQKPAVENLREIRFQPYEEGQALVAIDEVEGSLRLSLRAVHPPDHIGVDAFRDELLQQIDEAMEIYQDSNQPTASLE